MRRVKEVNRTKHMNRNKLTFESQNLVVDWIGFNIQGFVDVRPIVKYLFQNFRFNSTFAKGFTGKEKDLFFDFRN